MYRMDDKNGQMTANYDTTTALYSVAWLKT